MATPNKRPMLTEPISGTWRDKAVSYTTVVFGYGNDLVVDPYELFEPVLRATPDRPFYCVWHDPATDPEGCESRFPGQHGHIILQDVRTKFWNDTAWLAVKTNVENLVQDGVKPYFKTQNVFHPKELVAYLKCPGKKLLIDHSQSSPAMRRLIDSVTEEDIQDQFEKRSAKMNEKQTMPDAIDYLIQCIKESGCSTGNKLVAYYQRRNDNKFLNTYKRRDFKLCLEKANGCVTANISQSSVKDLLENFQTTYGSGSIQSPDGDILSQAESIEIMKKWCAFQNLDFNKFCKDVIQIMDKRIPKINTLYLKGESNSGKSWIIRSMQKLAVHYHQVSMETGSNFMYGDAVGKRALFMEEPIIAPGGEEKFKLITQGTGTDVPVKHGGDARLDPIPCFITSNHYIWNTTPSNKTAYLNRMIFYDNLKSWPYLKDVHQELNPLWLMELATVDPLALKVPAKPQFINQLLDISDSEIQIHINHFHCIKWTCEHIFSSESCPCGCDKENIPWYKAQIGKGESSYSLPNPKWSHSNP